jgi:hypothetical protein
MNAEPVSTRLMGDPELDGVDPDPELDLNLNIS